MKKNKIFCKTRLLVIVLVIAILSSCSSSNQLSKQTDKSTPQTNSENFNQESEVPEEMMEKRSILADPEYKNGFTIFGLSPEKDGLDPKAYFPDGSDKTGNEVHWQIAQWYARYSLADKKYTKQTQISPGVNQIESPTLRFLCDSNKNELIFTINGSKCYDEPRKTGDQGWTHLLISQNFPSEDNWNKFSTLDKFVVSMDTKLTKFEDHMGDAFNPDIHAAQFLMFIVTANTNENSPDYGQYIWFGIGMFDNRTETSGGGVMWDKGTGSMMYGLKTEDILVGDYHYFKDGKVAAGPDTPWVSYEVDVLKHINAALAVTQYKGFLKNTTADDLHFTAFNLGWELPGTYDVEMIMKNFEMTVMRKK